MHLRGQFFPGKLEIKKYLQIICTSCFLFLEISTEFAESIRVYDRAKETFIVIVNSKKTEAL